MTDRSIDKQFSLDQLVNLQVLTKKDDSEILRYSESCKSYYNVCL